MGITQLSEREFLLHCIYSLQKRGPRGAEGFRTNKRGYKLKSSYYEN